MPVTPPSTALEARLADTFRAARAELAAGWPACSRCHDGRDVFTERLTPRTNAWARRYRCRACEFRFSDLSGTPMAATHKPLAVWALLALLAPHANQAAPSWEALCRLTGIGRQRLTEMNERLRVSALADRWRALLERSDITIAALLGTFPEPRLKAFEALAGNARSTSHVRTLRGRKVRA